MLIQHGLNLAGQLPASFDVKFLKESMNIRVLPIAIEKPRIRKPLGTIIKIFGTAAHVRASKVTHTHKVRFSSASVTA